MLPFFNLKKLDGAEYRKVWFRTWMMPDIVAVPGRWREGA